MSTLEILYCRIGAGAGGLWTFRLANKGSSAACKTKSVLSFNYARHKRSPEQTTTHGGPFEWKCERRYCTDLGPYWRLFGATLQPSKAIGKFPINPAAPCISHIGCQILNHFSTRSESISSPHPHEGAISNYLSNTGSHSLSVIRFPKRALNNATKRGNKENYRNHFKMKGEWID